MQWSLQSLRVSVFRDAQPGHESWWSDVTGTEPVTVVEKPRERLWQFSGPWPLDDWLVLRLGYNESRIDWLLSAPSELDLKSPELRGIGELRSTLVAFREKLEPWIATLPGPKRIAFGASLFEVFPSIGDAATAIRDQCLRAQFVTEGAVDLVFQVNRRREIDLRPETVAMNRLAKWATQSIQFMRMEAADGKLSAESMTHMATLELDLSTIPTAPIPAQKSAPVLAVLSDLAVELASEGDIP